MDSKQLMQYGAKVRLEELDKERADLVKLLGGKAKGNGESKRKSYWTPARRKALSLKAKANWAKRKAEGNPRAAKKK